MKKELKTMIVDDEDVAADMLEIMLNQLGVGNITQITTGREAMEKFEAGLKDGSPYSLVFLDIIMPGMDGQETLKHLRAAEKAAGIGKGERSVIIMTTALTTTTAMIEALFEGDCSDYLVKPIDAGYLRGILVKNGFIA